MGPDPNSINIATPLQSTSPLAIAHRGGAGLRPENTLAAFRHAVTLGMDGIELDLQLSRDGIAMVHHDEHLDPAHTRGPDGQWLETPGPALRERTAAEIAAYDVGRAKPGTAYHARFPELTPVDGATIPTFGDVLGLIAQEAPPRFHLLVELKTPLLRPFSEADCAQLAAAALADIDRAGLRRTCRFVSFDWRTLGAAKHLAPDIPAAHTTLAFAAVSPTSNLPSDVSETAKRLRESNLAGAPWYGSADWRGMTGGSYGEKLLRAMAADGATQWLAFHEDVTWETAEIAHALGLSIAAWTVDDASEMRRLADLGVAAILSDRPDRLKTVLQELT